MIDVSPLVQQIQTPATRQLGIDDPAINEILALAEHNELLAAAEKAQLLWAQHVYDVRTLGCYLAGVYVEKGLATLPLILDCVLKALTLNWEYLNPEVRKQRLCDVSLRWLFTTLLAQIEFHHRNKTAQWERWNEGWTPTAYKESVERCIQLSVLLEDVIPHSRCVGPLFNLKAILDGIVRPSTETAGWKQKIVNATVIPALARPPETAAADSSSSAAPDGSDSSHSADSAGSATSSSSATSSGSSANSSSATSSGSSTGSDSSDLPKLPSEGEEPGQGSNEKSELSQTEQAGKSAASESGSDDKPPAALMPTLPTGESVTLPLSPALHTLMQLLDGFVQLMHAREFNKAVAIYRQVQPRIQQFDPRLYLPTLFGPFYAQLAQNGQQLTSRLQEPPALETEALAELCRVDFKQFLSAEIKD